ATQRMLNRGARLTELLKQPQFAPTPVEEQIIVIYAGTRGYLDKIDTAEVGRYESELRTWLRSKKSDLLAEIVQKKELDKAGVLEGKIKAALQEFGAAFA